jgi:hypothetical protein
LKKFDADNYIAPLTVYADNAYLTENNNRLDLSSMVQSVNNTESIKNTLSDFKKIILA